MRDVCVCVYVCLVCTCLLAQFLAWDHHARRKIDMVDRQDEKGDVVIAHEFDSTAVKNLIYDR